MSLTTLAEAIGYGAPMLSSIETGKQWPRAHKLPAFARALDTTIDALFEGVR